MKTLTSEANMNFVMGPAWQLQSEYNLHRKRVPVMRQRARYDFIEFVRPNGYHAYSVEQQFGVVRWMVETAVAIKPTRKETGRWGVSGPIELLAKAPSCVSNDPRLSIRSLEDLKERFHYALLSRWAGPSAVRWRRENGIEVTAQKVGYPELSVLND